MNPLIQLKKATPVLFVVLACFGLSPITLAVNPPPDGGYPGGNTAEGDNALFSLTTGIDNTATGYQALFHNRIGTDNTASGFQALYSNTTGGGNTADGSYALFSNTTGNSNTAIGLNALGFNRTGIQNTGIGVLALYNNTAGSDNTAIGTGALEANTTGRANTATGETALTSNATGTFNTATGLFALGGNTSGSFNTATGYSALVFTVSGRNNTANGSYALGNGLPAGSENTATGFKALFNNNGDGNTANGTASLATNTTGTRNTAEGANALQNNTTGSRNIALGAFAGGNLTTGDNNMDIGNSGFAGEAATIRIGTVGTQTDTFIAGIREATVQNALPVVVSPQGKLGTLPSSVRFKEAIKPMHRASEAILALKPVTFRYKNQTDTTPQFGLLAEDVAKVNPDLVVRDEHGEIYTVRYEAVNAMLLNEFLKEHRKNEEQQATIAQLKSGMEALTATVKEQAAQIQKVSAQLAAASPSRGRLEANKPTPQVVANDQ